MRANRPAIVFMIRLLNFDFLRLIVCKQKDSSNGSDQQLEGGTIGSKFKSPYFARIIQIFTCCPDVPLIIQMILENDIVRIIIAYKEQPSAETSQLLQAVENSHQESNRILRSIMDEVNQSINKIKAPTFTSTPQLLKSPQPPKNIDEQIDEKVCSWRDYQKGLSSKKVKRATLNKGKKGIVRRIKTSILYEKNCNQGLLKSALYQICTKGSIDTQKLSIFMNRSHPDATSKFRDILLQHIDRAVHDEEYLSMFTEFVHKNPYLDKIREIVRQVMFDKN